MALGQPEASRRAVMTSAGVAGTGVILSAAPARALGKGKPVKYKGQKLLNVCAEGLAATLKNREMWA